MSWKSGGCHCDAVRFEVFAPDEVEVQSCNCSICRMSGYLHLIVPRSRFRLHRGGDVLTSYVFNTETARHTFCSVCGIKSFYVPRSHPDGYSVNFRCLDAAQFHSVLTTEFDGRNWERHINELSPLQPGN
ncbi:MAG: GFA family protein [Rhizomicrobium sp.]